MKTSNTVHSTTTSTRYTNAGKLRSNFTDIVLSKGRTKQVNAQIVPVHSRKKLVGHVTKYRYKSTNSKVATVTAAGRIKAVGRGKCSIYVYAANGVSDRIIVTVN